MPEVILRVEKISKCVKSLLEMECRCSLLMLFEFFFSKCVKLVAFLTHFEKKIQNECALIWSQI